jgi:hypothetical protein
MDILFFCIKLKLTWLVFCISNVLVLSPPKRFFLFFIFRETTFKIIHQSFLQRQEYAYKFCLGTTCREITAQPAKLSRPSSKARSVLISKSLVGSSSSNTFPSSLKSSSQGVNGYSPPESVETFLFWSLPKLKRLKYARIQLDALPS